MSPIHLPLWYKLGQPDGAGYWIVDADDFRANLMESYMLVCETDRFHSSHLSVTQSSHNLTLFAMFTEEGFYLILTWAARATRAGSLDGDHDTSGADLDSPAVVAVLCDARSGKVYMQEKIN